MLRGIPSPTGCFPRFFTSICGTKVAMGDVEKMRRLAAIRENGYVGRVGLRVGSGGFPNNVTHNASRVASTACPKCRLVRGN